MMTLSKIAKLSNVSVSTASKAFSGSPEVNEETREMIFRVAREQGCFKKFYNAKFPKLVIAIIAPEFKSSYYTRYLSCLQDALGKENCELCVSTTDFSPEKEESLLEYYYKHSNVDGILILDSHISIEDTYEIPIVSLNSKRKARCAHEIINNMYPAMGECAAYLKSKGVYDVGFVGEKLTTGKCRSFAKALQEVGIDLPEENISTTSKRFEEGGYDAMEKLFAENRVPRAILCAYDYMAIGAIRCICDHGLRVPEDIAVLGMDNLREDAFLNPPLASISSKTQALCSLGAKAILGLINGEAVPSRQEVNSTFYLRRSFQIDEQF